MGSRKGGLVVRLDTAQWAEDDTKGEGLPITG
jgi:hypothetical protein